MRLCAECLRSRHHEVRGNDGDGEDRWGNVTIESIRADSEASDGEIWFAVTFRNYSPSRSLYEDRDVGERDHFFSGRFHRHFVKAVGVNHSGYGGSRISFCAERAALEEAVGRIRSAVAEWNAECFLAELAEWEDGMVEKVAESRSASRPASW